MRGGFRPRFFLEATPAGLDDPAAALDADLALDADDARHARDVLRARPGDPCEAVLLPWGLLAPATFTVVSRDEVRVRLETPLADPVPARLRITLVQALLPLASLDLVLEKGTEVGLDRFVIVPAEGSPRLSIERVRGRRERWARIGREAAKQSKQPGLPVVTVAASLAEAHEVARAEDSHHRLDVLLEPEALRAFDEVLEGTPLPDPPAVLDLTLWVGPEGGWSSAEVAALEGLGVMGCRLGRRVLRAETAGPAAAAAARFALRDW